VYLFAQNGLSCDNLSLWGTSWDALFGVVLFNFALVIAIPAWLYEKEPDVDVRTVIQGSSMLAAFLYILIGSLGAMTMPVVADNMLESMMSGRFGTSMQLGSSIFSFFIIGLGIPLFSVLTRLDLTGSGLCTEVQGNILAVMLPFSIAWTFYQGEAITQMLSWGGICFTSVVAFLLPLIVSYRALVVSDEEGSLRVFFWTSERKSKESQKVTLKVLLTLAVLSIIAAIVGNIIT
jgi:hypothetical protein